MESEEYGGCGGIAFDKHSDSNLHVWKQINQSYSPFPQSRLGHITAKQV